MDCDGTPPVVIVGAGGHGRVVLDVLRSAERRVIGFLDDNPSLHRTQVLGTPVLGSTRKAPRLVDKEGASFLVGVADNVVRGKLMNRLRLFDVPFASVVHPAATVASDVMIESGVVVLAGAVVNTGSRLRVGSLVNTSASVDHDCDLGEFAQVQPGSVLTGGVVVGRYAFIGSRAVVLPLKSIGENAYVGAGAVVVRDVSSNEVVVGVPARVIKYRESLEKEF
ncbi:acetyltransferase [Acidobacteria bacterium AH-259-L09]|nr:acetyltransferase [Acidobacteria bacterium AH-259-L09]